MGQAALTGMVANPTGLYFPADLIIGGGTGDTLGELAQGIALTGTLALGVPGFLACFSFSGRALYRTPARHRPVVDAGVTEKGGAHGGR